MSSVLLVGELKMESNTGLEEIHGEPIGVKMVSFELFEVQTTLKLRVTAHGEFQSILGKTKSLMTNLLKEFLRLRIKEL